MLLKILLLLLSLGLISCTTVSNVDSSRDQLQGAWTIVEFYCEDLALSNLLNEKLSSKELQLELNFNKNNFTQNAVQKVASKDLAVKSDGVFLSEDSTLRVVENVAGESYERVRFLDLEVDDRVMTISSESLCNGKPGMATFKKSTI